MMIHSDLCRVFETKRLDPTCPRCANLMVGEVDDACFERLMGCDRARFDHLCTSWMLHTGTAHAMGLPFGLYGFRDVILSANALGIQTRLENVPFLRLASGSGR